MDHFALEGDEMAVAYREGKLNRNFMGYTVLKGQDFIGLGVSSIGYVQGGYFQNEKDQKAFRNALDKGEFPLSRGLVLSDDDLMRKKIIEDLMCRFVIDREAWAEQLGRPFDKVFEAELSHIENCVEDGLLEIEGKLLKVTELGKLFVRNIAMGFDAHLKKDGAHRRFSRVI
jgi:oxygen-independent coproporphyrinogen-3 oxidase